MKRNRVIVMERRRETPGVDASKNRKIPFSWGGRYMLKKRLMVVGGRERKDAGGI